MANASRPNAFLLTIFEDRQELLDAAMANQSANEIKDSVIELTRISSAQKDGRFRNILDTVVQCVALKRMCGTGVGKWLNENCPDIAENVRASITEQCKFSATIFRLWDAIVHNLTNSEMEGVDPRNFTIRDLYEARKLKWCLAEKNQKVPKKSTNTPTDEQEYDETLYQSIIDRISDSRILHGVNFDPAQADLIADRIKSDLKRMCENARAHP